MEAVFCKRPPLKSWYIKAAVIDLVFSYDQKNLPFIVCWRLILLTVIRWDAICANWLCHGTYTLPGFEITFLNTKILYIAVFQSLRPIHTRCNRTAVGSYFRAVLPQDKTITPMYLLQEPRKWTWQTGGSSHGFQWGCLLSANRGNPHWHSRV